MTRAATKPRTRRTNDCRPTTGEILDRVPPFDLETELATLGSILLCPDVVDDVALIVRPDDFYDQAHAVLFGHLLAMHNDNRRIDLRLLVDRLKKAGDLERVGGSAYIATAFSSVPNHAHAVHYARIVHEKALRRRIIDAGASLIRNGFDDPGEASDLVARAEQAVFAIADRGTDVGQVHTASALMHRALDSLEARKSGKGVVGLSTGFLELDKITSGLRPGEVTIIAGRTSMGKTALALNIAEHVAVDQKKPVLVISLEMSADELGDRLLCSRAAVNSYRLRDGRLTEQEQARVAAAASLLSQSGLALDDTPSHNVAEIASVARRHKRKRGLELLVIDYLQLVTPDDTREPRQEQVARCSRRIKGIARELQVPVLCLAQLNRQPESVADRRPRLSHLRESGAIEQDADAVIFVHRPAYYEEPPKTPKAADGSIATPAAKKSGPEAAELIVAKQRNGRLDTAEVDWHGGHMRFADKPDTAHRREANGNTQSAEREF